MNVGLITVAMLTVLVLLLLMGLPVCFCLGSVALFFGLLLWGVNGLYIIGGNFYSSMSEFVLVAFPLFVFMGMMLERSGVADDLYEMMYHWMGPIKGGLAIGTVLICTIFAAMSGISATATVTMGVIALPSMLKRNYKKQIAIGCIMAGGALGVLIPPSGIMIIWGLFAEVSVGKLFMGGVIPGLLLSALFCIYIGIRAKLQPDIGPVLPVGERGNWKDKLILLRAVILPMLLIIGVLGSIYMGIATPSEAAAVGAFGSIITALIHKRFGWKVLKEATYTTFGLTCMVMWIVIGGYLFTAFYQGIGGPQFVRELLATLPLSPTIVLIGIQITYFIMGCFMDPTGIVMITAPIYVPVIKTLGFDPVWFGILFVMNMEMGYLTPPFGYNLFYMKGVAPDGVTMADIYNSVWPFVSLQALGLIMVMIFPQIALWLPNKMMG